jgi:hypothetical protein
LILRTSDTYHQKLNAFLNLREKNGVPLKTIRLKLKKRASFAKDGSLLNARLGRVLVIVRELVLGFILSLSTSRVERKPLRTAQTVVYVHGPDPTLRICRTHLRTSTKALTPLLCH